MEIMKHRIIFKVKGKDKEKFFQGIISNDINKLEKDNIIYALLLTPQGKLLFDMFIFRNPLSKLAAVEKELGVMERRSLSVSSIHDASSTNATQLLPTAVEFNDEFWVDCDTSVKELLIKKLSMYKLRSDITIEDNLNDYKVYFSKDKVHGEISLSDPRANNFGYRVYMNKEHVSEDNYYNQLRVEYGISEFGIDMLPEKGFPLEYCMDKFNAIDFKKGCYVGQELTSRMKNKLLNQKRTIYIAKKLPVTVQFGDPVYVKDSDLEIGQVLSCTDSMCMLIGNMNYIMDNTIRINDRIVHVDQL